MRIKKLVYESQLGLNFEIFEDRPSRPDPISADELRKEFGVTHGVKI